MGISVEFFILSAGNTSFPVQGTNQQIRREPDTPLLSSLVAIAKKKTTADFANGADECVFIRAIRVIRVIRGSFSSEAAAETVQFKVAREC